jgi:hypothetical protein
VQTVVAEVIGALIVVACAVASTAMVGYTYRRETHRPASRKMLALIAAWFLLTYGVTTFLVIVR